MLVMKCTIGFEAYLVMCTCFEDRFKFPFDTSETAARSSVHMSGLGGLRVGAVLAPSLYFWNL